jgi:hypothetical protein
MKLLYPSFMNDEFGLLSTAEFYLSNSGVAVVWEHIMSVMVPILPEIYSLLNLKIAGILNLVGLSLLLISLGRLHAKMCFSAGSAKFFSLDVVGAQRNESYLALSMVMGFSCITDLAMAL